MVGAIYYLFIFPGAWHNCLFMDKNSILYHCIKKSVGDRKDLLFCALVYLYTSFTNFKGWSHDNINIVAVLD